MSLRGQCGPSAGSSHSVMKESDYVCPQMAKVLGIHMGYVVKALECGVHIRLREPRIVDTDFSFCLDERDDGEVEAEPDSKHGCRPPQKNKGQFDEMREKADRNCLKKGPVGKPHPRVTFKGFVQAIAPNGAKSFEILGQGSDGGRIKCAASCASGRSVGQQALAEFMVRERCQSQCSGSRGLIEVNESCCNDRTVSFVTGASCFSEGRSMNKCAPRAEGTDCTGNMAESNCSSRASCNGSVQAERGGPGGGEGATATQKQLLCLDESVPQGWRDQTRSSRALHLGTTIDELVHVVGQFGLEKWRVELSEVGKLHVASEAVLRDLPVWDRCSDVESLRVYVDGSHFGAQKAAWAAVAVGRIGLQWVWIGFISGKVHSWDSPHCIGDGACNAHTAELHAMIYALCAVCALDCVTAEIIYDATTAAAVAQGLMSSARHQQLAHLANNLTMVAKGRCCLLSYRHVKSHRGEPLNELADTVAKATAAGLVEPFAFEGRLAEVERSGAVEWWWTMVSQPGALPPKNDDGDIVFEQKAGSVSWEGQQCVPGVPREVQEKIHVAGCGAEWTLNLITYDANSVKHEATRQYLDRMFSRVGAQLIGIQESRTYTSARISTLHYECYCSPCQDGGLGCQLWIKKNAKVARLSSDSHACFDVDHVVALESQPRLLVAVVDGGKQKFGCVVAHAPTSSASDECIHNWWEQLRAAIRRLPRNAIPLLFLDANARFENWSNGGATQGSPKGSNAFELHMLLKKMNLTPAAAGTIQDVKLSLGFRQEEPLP